MKCNAQSRRDFLNMTGRGIIAAGLIGSNVFAHDAFGQDASGPKVPGPPPDKTRWAIVGLGKLALEELLPAFALADKCQVTALVSGHRDKAEQTARHYGVDAKHIYSYDDFDRIKNDDQIDIVYIVLPNHMHAEYTIRALRAGKHVLCEKPMAASVDEAQRMVDAARSASRKLMIAYRLRYEPFNQTVIDLCRKQMYGKIKLISAVNAQDVQPPNIRLQKSAAGGPLGDLGIYCLNAARYVSGEEPIEVSAMSYQPEDDPRFREVDESVTFQLRFPSGVLAECAASFGTAEARRYRVTCTKGWIDLENAFGYSGQRLNVSDNRAIANLKLEPVNHFASEMNHLSECVQTDKHPITPGEEGLADMKVMAAITEACKTGKTVKLA